MWLFLAFIAVPLIEIGLFIQVGGLIGLWPTLAIVLLTAIVGTWMVKQQGISTLRRLQSSLNELSDPSEPLASGAMILFAGALLLTPGFFTDAMGLSLLVPGIRSVIFREVRKRVKVQSFTMGGATGQGGGSYGGPRPGPHSGPRAGGRGGATIIDGEYSEVDTESGQVTDGETRPPKQPTHQPSGWTRH